LAVQSPKRFEPVLSDFLAIGSDIEYRHSYQLCEEELDCACGGMTDLENNPGFHTIWQIKINPNSPLYGNISFHDTIDNDDNLPEKSTRPTPENKQSEQMPAVTSELPSAQPQTTELTD